MNISNIKVIRNGKTFDVFIGDGWENWSRIQKNKDGSLTHIAGLSLPKFFFKYLQENFK